MKSSDDRKKKKNASKMSYFQVQYETDFIYTPNSKCDVLICLVCFETFSVMKDFNLIHHYTGGHSREKNKIK